MRLIDTHCHLAHGRLGRGVAGVLDRAAEAGVLACVCAAGDVHEAGAALEIARRYPNVFCTAGVHPHAAKDFDAAAAAALEDLAAADRNVAVGEIGLDYHYDLSPRGVQREVFAAQLAIAGRAGKAVVVHTREAFDETLAILNEADLDGTRVVFHSFTEGPILLRRALDLGAMISFSGIATFKKAGKLRAAAAGVPDDRILIETDCPYLSPEPVRRQETNEPANVAHVAACLAAVRGVSAERFAETTTENAVRFFGLTVGESRGCGSIPVA